MNFYTDRIHCYEDDHDFVDVCVQDKAIYFCAGSEDEEAWEEFLSVSESARFIEFMNSPNANTLELSRLKFSHRSLAEDEEVVYISHQVHSYYVMADYDQMMYLARAARKQFVDTALLLT